MPCCPLLQGANTRSRWLPWIWGLPLTPRLLHNKASPGWCWDRDAPRREKDIFRLEKQVMR